MTIEVGCVTSQQQRQAIWKTVRRNLSQLALTLTRKVTEITDSLK
jgi:hypothetical protein